jgi:hypothetical protein
LDKGQEGLNAMMSLKHESNRQGIGQVLSLLKDTSFARY